MKKRLLFGFVILILIAVGTALWFTRPHAARGPRAITIAQSGDFFLYAPLYVAIDAGLFEKKNLHVSLVTTGGDEKTWAAVLSGSASFGVGDPSFVAVSDMRGQPGRIIASIVNGVPFWGVTLKDKIPVIKDARQLNNYVIGTFPAPSTAFTLQKKMFMDAGLQPHIREGAFGTMLTMLRAGQVDIALELEPNVSQAVADGARVVYSMKEVYGPFAITGLSANPDSLSRDPNLATDVVCGIQMSLDYIRNNPEQSLQILMKRFPEVRPGIARAALARVVSEGIIPTDLVIGERAWQNAIQPRKEVGDVPNPKPMQAYVDNRFAETAISTCRLAR